MIGQRATKREIVLGQVDPPAPIFNRRITLGQGEQDAHATVWGKTGSGKSKLLQNVFVQHLNLGNGAGLLEPHHDLSFDTLCFLVSTGFFQDERAYERLIYWDLGNGAYVPFNVLAGRQEPHTIALNALEAMLRVWPELVEAPMFQTLFLSGLIALIANQLPITYLYKVLTDQEFRSRCLRRVDDALVHQSFGSFDQLGRDQAQAAGSTLRRAFLLSFSPLARNTLGQPDNWLDFRAIMDSGRSFIINLGNINDHETRKLLGALLLVQIEQAALSRTDVSPAERVPFTLLVDEWPSFAAQDNTIGTILSQTRKFKLRLYLAAQSLSQISSRRLSGALENCRLTIAFALGRDSAETHAKHIGQVDVRLVKEEALTPTQHNQFMSISEQFESWIQDLQNLPPRVAYLKTSDQPAVRFRTLDVPSPKVDQNELANVLATYRSRYQRTPEEAEKVADLLNERAGSAAHNSSTTAVATEEPAAEEPAYMRAFRRLGEEQA